MQALHQVLRRLATAHTAAGSHPHMCSSVGGCTGAKAPCTWPYGDSSAVRHPHCSAVDAWAAGCIMAELLMLRPLFPGDEDKRAPDAFQHDQLAR